MTTLRAAIQQHLQPPPDLLDQTPAERALMRPEAPLHDRETCEKGPSRESRDLTPAAAYLARLAPGSQPTMRAALAALARRLGSPDIHACPWHRLTYAHTAALRAQLAASLAPATANKILAALRGVLLEARRLGLMGADACAAARDIAPVRGRRLPAGRALEAAELAAVLRACAADAGPRGRRDAAIIAVGYGAGLRRAELVGLALADYAPASRALTVRRGKGNADRQAFLGQDWARLLEVWIAARGRRAGALFVAIGRAGRVLPRGLHASTVRQICLARGAQAGIARFSPHDLRRSFITALLDTGLDIGIVQDCAGHANIATTKRYDRRGERAQQAAVERLRMPVE